MKKLLPILAISLCALLMLSLGRPVTANPSFPADGDTLEYDISISITGVNASTGPNLSETFSLDAVIEFINHSGDYYWANQTVTFPDDEIFYPMNGSTIASGGCHYHPDNEAPLMFPVNPTNWTQLAPMWSSDILLIEGGTQPGDTLTFGYGETGYMYNDPPYADPYGGYYTQFTLPVGPGSPLVVSGVTLSTVMIGMDYEQHYNSSNPTYPMWDIVAEFNVSWEWSLGFLAQMQFDIYLNLNPNYPGNMNLTSLNIEGGITLVSAITVDPVSPGPWEAVPAIPGFPIVAVIMGLFAALVPVVLVRKRRK